MAPSSLSTPSSSSTTIVSSSSSSLTLWWNLLLWYGFRTGTVMIGLVAIAGGLLYKNQDKLLYFPEIQGIPKRPRNNPRGYRSPEERQIPYENLFIPTSDGVMIHAWLLLYKNDNNNTNSNTKKDSIIPTIVFFHGNAGNIGLRLPNAIQMIQYLQCHILLVEYRGYGDSDVVSPNEMGLQLDAIAVWKFIQHHPNIDPASIFLYGQSLGGAVAIYLAHTLQQPSEKDNNEYQHLPAGIIVENTFLSISHMVDQLMPFLKYIKPWVLRIGWNSYQIIDQISNVPILFLSGAKDELVPPFHMKVLYEKSLQNPTCPLTIFHSIPDGTHNDSWLQGGPQYWDTTYQFIRRAMSLVVNNNNKKKEVGGSSMKQ